MLYNLKTTAKKTTKRQLNLAPTRDKKTSPRVTYDIKNNARSLISGQAQTETSHNVQKVKTGRMVDS